MIRFYRRLNPAALPMAATAITSAICGAWLLATRFMGPVMESVTGAFSLAVCVWSSICYGIVRTENLASSVKAASNERNGK